MSDTDISERMDDIENKMLTLGSRTGRLLEMEEEIVEASNANARINHLEGRVEQLEDEKGRLWEVIYTLEMVLGDELGVDLKEAHNERLEALLDSE